MPKTIPLTTKFDLRQARYCQIIAWTAAALTSALALLAWGQGYAWHFLPLSIYVLFPLLGLLAYSLMWSHYVAALARTHWHLPKAVLNRYFEITSIAVLILVSLHPTLLIYQRFRDGFGLPPHSYESYVAPGLGWITLLGTASLFIFWFYEFRRRYGRRGWWHYAQMAVDAAMLAIFYHALRLGHQIHGWFRIVWWFYGIVLVLILIRTYWQKYTPKTTSN